MFLLSVHQTFIYIYILEKLVLTKAQLLLLNGQTNKQVRLDSFEEKKNIISDQKMFKMDTRKAVDVIISCVKNSNLNYQIQESLFSLIINLRKTFIKNKNGDDIQLY